MDIRDGLKKLLPTPIVNFLREKKLYCMAIFSHRYSIYRESKYSSNINTDMETRLTGLMILSHVLEKGITMPDRRMGFGYARVREVIDKCSKCIQDFGPNHLEIQATLCDLKQYIEIHDDAHYSLPDDITNGVHNLMNYLCIHDENCYQESAIRFFKPVSSFEELARSRKTIRSFSSKEVDNEMLLKAISLAQTAPSACNRQATRVKIISNKKIIEHICDNIQNGSRGFGKTANKWLLITSIQGAWQYKNTSASYLDAGIFTMNLLYSLHYYGIGACTLNSYMKPSKQKELQKLLGYPESEIPIVFIAIGIPTESFMIAKSRRLPLEEIVNEIK